MRLFSFYLPQFHEIPENDEWWGKGFTEWTNVRKAKPLFRSHIQPLHPADGNYYDLLDLTTVRWQTDLMKKYGIDGQIYYHYYFNGRMLLEKPAENLLHHQEIGQNFFFCWANHDWNRAWQGSKTVLMKQEYGTEADWEKHFQYLLPFFQDERYEKKENCPVLMLFNSGFEEKEAMCSYFNKRCMDVGFDGLYMIETFNGEDYPEGFSGYVGQIASTTKAVFLREPTVSKGIYWRSLQNLPKRFLWHVKSRMKGETFHVLNGNRLYRSMKKEKDAETFTGRRIIHGVHFGFDNTPRHGKRGYIITPPSRKCFFRTMDSLKEDEYVFLNAWNEWAEGMTVEPTVEYQYRYLEWVREWKKEQGASL